MNQKPCMTSWITDSKVLYNTVRYRYNAAFSIVVDPAWDWYSASVSMNIYAMSYNLGPRYKALNCISEVRKTPRIFSNVGVLS